MKRSKKNGRGCGCCGCPGCLLILIVVLWAGVALWHSLKPLPEGTRVVGDRVPIAAEKVTLLADVTAVDADGTPALRQEIFDRMLQHIAAARRLILVDNFLFNEVGAEALPSVRRLCREFTNALLEAKDNRPGLRIIVITDPINEIYGGATRPHLRRLRSGGVEVVMTDLTRLRDSNPLWSGWWRLGPSRLDNACAGGLFPNPFAANDGKVTLRSWLSLLNFKANHRKVFLTDDGHGGWVTLIGSLNLHDASSAHSNIALEISSAALAAQVFAAEGALLRLSGAEPPTGDPVGLASEEPGGELSVRLLTESAVRDHLIDMLETADRGDRIDIAVFYLSHRGVIDALTEAAGRGVEVRIILDPSKDAFGRTKSGIPNRQAAFYLMRRGRGRLTVRWYDTHGEQFHPKTAVLRSETAMTVILGSANFTRRNLDDLNLEADVLIEGPLGSSLDRDLGAWFDRLWTNDGLHCTVAYEEYEDSSRLRRLTAALQERTGMCTF